MTNTEIVELVARFNDALNSRDADAMMRLMTEDCVFENTFPAPDGTRHAGQKSVHAFWEDFFRSLSEPHIESEEIFALDNRCVMVGHICGRMVMERGDMCAAWTCTKFATG